MEIDALKILTTGFIVVLGVCLITLLWMHYKCQLLRKKLDEIFHMADERLTIIEDLKKRVVMETTPESVGYKMKPTVIKPTPPAKKKKKKKAKK